MYRNQICRGDLRRVQLVHSQIPADHPGPCCSQPRDGRGQPERLVPQVIGREQQNGRLTSLLLHPESSSPATDPNGRPRQPASALMSFSIQGRTWSRDISASKELAQYQLVVAPDVSAPNVASTTAAGR